MIAIRSPFLSPAMCAVNHALNVDASSVRRLRFSRSARLAFVRVAEACASFSDDSVPHFAEA